MILAARRFQLSRSLLVVERRYWEKRDSFFCKKGFCWLGLVNMELKRSVIARLMGLEFDDMPSQHEVPKQGRVLSDKYLKKVALIGVREQSPPERSEEYYNDFFKHKKDKPHRSLVEREKLTSKSSGSSEASTFSSREKSIQHTCSSSTGSSNVWGDCFKESEAVGQTSSVSSEQVEEISRQINNLKKSNKDSSSLHKEATRQISERWKTVKDFQDPRQPSRGWTLGEMLSMHDHGISCPFLNRNPCGSVDHKGTCSRSTNFERHPRMRRKDKTNSHFNWSKRSQVAGDISLKKKDAITFTKEDLHQGRKVSGCIYFQSTHSADVESNSSLREIEVTSTEMPNRMELSSKKNSFPIEKASVMQHKELTKKHRIWKLSWENNAAPDLSVNLHNSHVQTTKQDESIEIPEEVSVSSDSCSDSESFKSFLEACQLSRDSVLEPFQNSPSNLSDHLSGMQFHPFNKLVPSSTTSPEEKEDSSRFEKSRDFCYLNDVLTRAGFHGVSLIRGLSKWHSTECPPTVSPLVFETIEKEYGEHKSWRRSERKLLFDRINLGLCQIFQQYTTCFISLPKPISTRMSSTMLCYELTTEDVLWNLLARQEQEPRKESSDKVVEEDDDFGEYIDFIGRELENLLVDELAAEFLSW